MKCISAALAALFLLALSTDAIAYRCNSRHYRITMARSSIRRPVVVTMSTRWRSAAMGAGAIRTIIAGRARDTMA